MTCRHCGAVIDRRYYMEWVWVRLDHIPGVDPARCRVPAVGRVGHLHEPK